MRRQGYGSGRGMRRRARFWREGSGGTEGASHIVQVDPEKCVGCGNCARACPFGAISVISGKAVVDPRYCRSCRVCVSSCPTGAIS